MKKVICEKCGVELVVTNKTENFRCAVCRFTTITNQGSKIHEGCHIHTNESSEKESPIIVEKSVELKPVKERVLIPSWKLNSAIIDHFHAFEINSCDGSFIVKKPPTMNSTDFAFELFMMVFDLDIKNRPVFNYYTTIFGLNYEND